MQFDWMSFIILKILKHIKKILSRYDKDMIKKFESDTLLLEIGTERVVRHLNSIK